MMASDDLSELQEQVDHAKEHPALAPVSVTMAILAVLVALVSLVGHRTHTEEIVLQAKASDQWALYQAKNVRQHLDLLFSDMTSVQPATDAAALAKLTNKYSQEANRYLNEQKDVETEARRLEADVAIERVRADRFDLAEVFLEVGLVITSITLLTGRRFYWNLGMILAALGIVVAATGFLVH